MRVVALEAHALLYRRMQVRLFKPYPVLFMALVAERAVVEPQPQDAYEPVGHMAGLALLVGYGLVQRPGTVALHVLLVAVRARPPARARSGGAPGQDSGGENSSYGCNDLVSQPSAPLKIGRLFLVYVNRHGLHEPLQIILQELLILIVG